MEIVGFKILYIPQVTSDDVLATAAECGQLISMNEQMTAAIEQLGLEITVTDGTDVAFTKIPKTLKLADKNFGDFEKFANA